MKDAVREARERLIRWILDLLGRSESSWDPAQRRFIHSLLEGQEGTKTLAELAITCARIHASGLKPGELGSLRPMHEAIEEFWNNPCAETYEQLRTAGEALDSDSEQED
jgi:hypothetical protein